MDPSPQPLALAIHLVAAFTLAGIAQVLWLGSAWSRHVARPIDGRGTFRGRRLLGDHKTWRGFVVMVPASGVAFLILALLRPELPRWWAEGLWAVDAASYLLAGLCAGLGFMLGELPNSFLKRQLDIAPGSSPCRPLPRAVFAVIDRVDSILGMLIALALILPVPPWTWIYVLVLGPPVHLAFSALLHVAKVKPRLA